MTPLRVLDVSRWQGCIDWDAVQRSSAIDGVMLRVLGSRNGQPYPDPQFERNHAACTARGIPVGGYYYTCAVTSRQTEAELNALRAEGGILHYQRIGEAETAEIIVNRTEHIIVETLASGKSTEVNPMGFTIVVEEVGHNPNHSYYDYV